MKGARKHLSSRIWRCGAAVILVACSLAGCGDAADERSAAGDGGIAGAGLTLPAGPVADRPWARQSCTPGNLEAGVLACVHGAAITRADYERARANLPPSVAPARVVDSLIAAELLAGKARAAGLWSSWLLGPYKRALAQAWLQDVFEAAHPAAKVAKADIDHAFRNATIRVRYKRQRSFFVTDAQLLCCSGDWKQCERREDVHACIKKNKPAAIALHQALAADPPATAAEMQARTVVLAQRFPGVAVAEVQFYYDTSKSYDEQEGYDLMVQPYAEAVIKLSQGQISEPILTPFGWHIARVDRIMPPLDGKPTDPEVRDDIARNILPMVRRRDLQKTIFDTMKRLGVKIHFDRLTR